jgi:hypothetical protein
MSLGLGWKLKDADEVAAGGVVAPDERLGWGKTVGLGAQHVVAMFGATFVFPLIMGLNPQLAIMMSGIATIIFLLIVQGRCPATWGRRRPSSVRVAAIRANGGDLQGRSPAPSSSPASSWLIVGVIIHFAGSGFLHKALPAGRHRCGRHADRLQPRPGRRRTSTGRRTSGWRWLTMLFTIIVAVAFRGFIGRISVFLALIFGTLLSLDPRQDRRPDHLGPRRRHRGDRAPARGTPPGWARPWFGLPPATTIWQLRTARSAVGWHYADLLDGRDPPRPARRHRAHRREHRSRQGRRRDDRPRPRPGHGPAIAGDGVGTAVASLFGGSPTTTYAENIGVMAATRVYSTAAYWVAALVALLFGLSPKFGALVSSVPGRRPRRHHRGPLRHDRPARRQDLEGERRRLRQPDQPGPGRGRHRHRHR